MKMKFLIGFHLKNGFFGIEIHFLVSSFTAKFRKRYFII